MFVLEPLGYHSDIQDWKIISSYNSIEMEGLHCSKKFLRHEETTNFTGVSRDGI